MLGFFTTTNQRDAFSFECHLDADIVIQCVDAFSHQLVKKTVVILDHSPLHHSQAFEAQFEKWKARG